jgi:hypothetical protein
MEINKRVIKKPYYGKTLPYSFGYFQMDLMDMISYRKYNDGYGYGLVIVEIRSRYVWVYKVKSKDETWKALKEWLSDWDFNDGLGEKKVVYTDEGGEFGNKFTKLLEEEKIKHVRVNSKDRHQEIVERVIRTLKERIRDVWYTENTFNWIKSIDLIVEEYNNNFHSGIKAKPVEILSGDVDLKVKSNLGREPDILPGEFVRVLKNKEGMDKPSLVNNWSLKKYNVEYSIGNNYTLSDGKTYPRWKLTKAVQDDIKEGFERKRAEVKRVRKEGRVIKKKLGNVKAVEAVQKVGKTLQLNPKELAELVLKQGRTERVRKVNRKYS